MCIVGQKYHTINDIRTVRERESHYELSERFMTKTVYIAGMPEAVKDNRARMQELGNILREGGYEVTGRQGKEPWQMTRGEFAKTAIPLQDRKDFIKAWLKDNEDIPDMVKPGFNYIEQRNGSLLVYGNQRGQAIGIISMRKDVVEHIAVSDRYKDRGIATQLLEESRKYGVRRMSEKSGVKTDLVAFPASPAR